MRTLDALKLMSFDRSYVMSKKNWDEQEFHFLSDKNRICHHERGDDFTTNPELTCFFNVDLDEDWIMKKIVRFEKIEEKTKLIFEK